MESTERRDGMEDRIDPWSSSTSTDYEAIITRFGLERMPLGRLRNPIGCIAAASSSLNGIWTPSSKPNNVVNHTAS